ncbi:LamG-like jellyroll fold domain-containing protein [Streptomyces sp. RFCAC02]|uniref:LamG-like jellyroll fold domain-containing protein n=1 Tax=Streptomyces sp. RFCAC02 TaxID=2499143 RepID=UPI001021A98A|nr:LamG-like jellyroll fold domain-containing protein [Streptomyces sp. RFCAC02]
MVVTAASDPAAAAARQLRASSSQQAGELPVQEWSDAAGRGHSVGAEETTADTEPDGTDPGRASDELPLAPSESTVEDLGETEPSVAVPDPEVVETEPTEPASGFSEETSVELPAERDEQSRTYLNADGTYTTRYYNEPVNFALGDGSWKPIDTALTRTAETASSWTTEATDAGIAFAAEADDAPLVRMDLDAEYSVAYSLAGAAASVGEVDESVITYRDVFTEASVEFIGGNDTVKETLVLGSPAAPRQWHFPLELVGLTAALDEHGGVTFADAEGIVRAYAPTGWMEDADVGENSGQGAISAGVSYSLSRDDQDRQVLTVTLDDEWLDAPERVYPVRVDPSVTRVEASSSTYVQRPYNTNFSTDTVLKTGTYDGGAHAAASFLRFSGVESSLRNAWVLDARLALYNTWSYSCTARPVTVRPITENWSAGTLEDYPGPSTGAALATDRFAHGWRADGYSSWACAPAWETISLGSSGRRLVDDWTHGRKNNYGLAITASTTDSLGWKQFGSTRYPNGAPSLDVTWIAYGATYRAGQLTAAVTSAGEGVQKITVTNQGRETWPANGKYTLRYDLYDEDGTKLTSPALQRGAVMPEDVSPGETVTLDARIAPLDPGTYTLDWTMAVNATRFTDLGVPGTAVRIEAVNIPPRLTSAAPGSGVVLDTLTPTLWAEGTDRDHYPNARVQYSFEVCEVDGENVRKNCRTGSRSTAQQWAVPSGWLSWNKTYAWYAYVNDGESTSLRPNPSLFTTQVPQPSVTGHLGGEDGHEFSGTSGNYATSATDAAVSTVGPELSVTRTYNSLDFRTDTAFGPGWTTRWDMRARTEADGSVLITLPEGSRVRFGRNANGTYTGPAGGSGTLTPVSGGGWVLRDTSGATYTFAAGGTLSTVTDSAGRQQNLTYDGDQLATVQDMTSGRTLTFDWQDGRVSTVSTNAVAPDEPGLTWSYTYTDGQLTRVCPPSGEEECTEYTYEDGSLYRSAVLDRNPVAYWRLDESGGGTAASTAPSRTGFNDADYYSIGYSAEGALTGTSDTAATFNGTDSVVRLPHDTIRNTTFLSVELWFRTTSPGVLVGFQSDRLEDGKPTSWSPPLTVDTNGKLRGYFFTGDRGNITPITSSASVTDGAWHHAVLTGEGTSQTLYLDGDEVGSLAGPIDHLDMSFTYLGAGYSSSGFDGAASGVRRFSGELDEVAVYHRPLDATTVAEHYALRNATGRITNVTLPTGRTHAHNVYDDISGRITEHTDEDGGTWQISAPTYSGGSAVYADTVRGLAPSGYWRLNERSGAVAASALGENLPGEYLGDVRLGGPGPFADGDTVAPYFTGARDSAVEVPREAWGTSGEQTVELWFRTSESGVIVGMQNTPMTETPTGWWPVLLVDGNGKLRGRLRPGEDATLTSQRRVDDDQWHHVLLSASATGQNMRVDGTLVGTSTDGTDTRGMNYTYIGGGYSSGSWDDKPNGYRPFTGQIAEVAFYDHARLELPEALTAYRAGMGQISGSGAAYRGAVTGDGPVAYWRMDDTDNIVTDETGEHPGTPTGQLTVGISSIFANGDGVSTYLNGEAIAIPGNLLTGTSDVTAEMWFLARGPGVLYGLQSAPLGETPATYRPVLNIDEAGKLRGQWYVLGGSTTPITSSQSVLDGKWHYAVLTGSGTTQKLYLDGAVVGTLNGTVTGQGQSYGYLGAGAANDSWMGVPEGTYYFNGHLDEVALYRHALTEGDVAAHYAARSRHAASALGATVTVTDPLGHTTSTTYDALRGHRKVASTDAAGGVTTYAYDTGGFLHTVTDPAGNVTITGHDARGNTVSNTTCRGPHNCQTSYTDHYLNAGDPLDPRNDRPTATADARSTGPADPAYRTTMSYSAQGLPTETVLPDGRTTRRTYTTGTEPAFGGGTTPAGLLATDEQADGTITRYAYYANGDTARTTHPSGLVTEYTYDGLGRVLTETEISDSEPDGVTLTLTYDELSRVVTETDTGSENAVTDELHTAEVTRTFDADGNQLTETIADITGDDPPRSTSYRYDDHGRLDRTIDAEGNTSYTVYDEMGRVVENTDPAGTVIRYTYTPLGQHATSVLEDWTGDPTGEVRDLTLESHAYDPAGRLAASTDAMGATTAYTYYGDGLVATVTAQDVDGRDIVIEDNTYDRAGHLLQRVSNGGLTTVSFEVDTTGRTIASVLDPDDLNRRTTYTYDDADRLLEERRHGPTEEEFLATAYTYDSLGNPLTETVSDADGESVTQHTYDQRGLLTSTTTPRGNTTDFAYDALGRLTTAVGPEADGTRPRTVTGYNTFGDITHTRDPLNGVSRTAYDDLGRPTSVTRPDYTPPGGGTITATETIAYDSLGRVASTSDALGRTSTYTYDQLGHLIRRTDPDPGTEQLPSLLFTPTETEPILPVPTVTTYSWTPTGLQLSMTDPTGARTEATYDALGRQLTQTVIERYPTTANLTTTYTWDDAGNQITSRTPAGRTATATYNAAGEVLTVADGLGHTTQYGYDTYGRQTDVTDATGHHSRTHFNHLNLAVTTEDYGTGDTVLRAIRAEYDADGNTTATTSATGTRTLNTYDALGRLTQRTVPVDEDTSITTGYGYDAAGNRTTMTDGRGNTTRYTYTPWGQPESTIEPATDTHPEAADRTWTTIYDASGQAVTELLPGGVERHRTHDALGRMTRETGSGAEAPTTDRVFTYDLAGRMTGQATGDLTGGNTYTYNDRGQLLTANGPGGTSAYEYNADGQMTKRTDAAGATVFAYDSVGRLDWAGEDLYALRADYYWDDAGRLLSQTWITPQDDATRSANWEIHATRHYTYDDLGRLTGDELVRGSDDSRITATTYDYDLDDRLTTRTTDGITDTYGYDDAGRLSSWTRGDTTTDYGWDASGNRTSAGDTTAVYDERNRLLTDGDTTYTYTPRGTLASTGERTITSDAFERRITDGETTYRYDSLDRVTQHNDTSFTYDGGSNNLVSDGTALYRRDPGGALLEADGQPLVTDQHSDVTAILTDNGATLSGTRSYDPFGQPLTEDGTLPALGYQSGWTDPDSGDVNMAARWYQPGTGSFASRDTWLVETNRYAYIAGSPLNGTDPTGHCVDGCVIEVAVALLGAAAIASIAGYVSQQAASIDWTGWLSVSSPSSFYDSLTDLVRDQKAARSEAAKAHLEAARSARARASELEFLRRAAQNIGRGISTARPSTGSAGSYSGYSGYSGGGGIHSGSYAGYASAPVITPPPPPPPQNPNRGPNPTPAPALPPAQPHWNADAGRWELSQGWAMSMGRQAVLDLIEANRYVPGEDEDGLPEAFPDESREPGGENGNSEKCDDAGENARGNIVYLPRERFRPGPDGCRATGIIGIFDEPEDMEGGTPTAWNNNCAMGMVTPSDYWQLPKGARARGHLAGCQFGGSGTDLRNLVPLHMKANAPAMSTIENRIAEQVIAGQDVRYIVTPVYDPTAASGVPAYVHLQAYGNRGMAVDCYVHNVAQKESPICLNRTYVR